MSCQDDELETYKLLITSLIEGIDLGNATKLAQKLCGDVSGSSPESVSFSSLESSLRVSSLERSLDANFVLTNTYLIFFMQVVIQTEWLTLTSILCLSADCLLAVLTDSWSINVSFSEVNFVLPLSDGLCTLSRAALEAGTLASMIHCYQYPK